MLHLKLDTDPRWAKIAEQDLEEILSDHAWCEQKAATNAITIITLNSEHEDLVEELTELAQEELEHFQRVCKQIKARGYKLGRERKDHYVNELYKFMNKGGNRLQSMVDRLLFSAMIEARSCERFKLLHKHIEDEELSQFYYELMVSEAGHYTTFITLARKYGKGIDVEKRWQELVTFEADLIKNYGTHGSIHG
ncbi:tRNA-(ms[2]io[6]A)-hydroxylase [Aurantibacter aestuarii]|uniref:tRNA 2-methylthio-N6-isopentenyl adenosine(37) hydroxylase MiaE n=1 Tax=Aurantibacter aestuarii TaxID=1266046 RepID=A0A2T1N9I8_9FLAO|nr:tRNA-(ms[2]io[6]A)-hydroxylase [Aurantibacter aestuarii]PSG88547.1 tRNA 2-methylthio-N6-isopentenyl adenosine(37) hydroxylase MiaE [Aurantibacter aestuarii]